MSIVMDKYDALEEDQNLKYFSTVFGFSQVMGALSVILVAVWMGTFGEGFGWTMEPAKQFHYHPLFMTIGMIFLYGEAILVYRVFRHERKQFTKALHVIIHSMIFIFFIVGLKAVFDSHNNNVDKDGKKSPSPNMYSLHSWVGLTTVLLFCLQYLFGFVSFLFPGLQMPVRQWYMPIHQYFGMAIFVLASATAVMGISERAAFHSEKAWMEFEPEGYVINFLGVTILMYAMSVVYLVANPRFKRRSLVEEESLQQLHTTD